ncbi:hypothetical protein C8046_12585 [Serinibacter arcticus]|uniref:2,3,4,5-tetrahydropyridine-2,6-dicarboxylate N-acetyltransferase n=2 Tax=Serinibacter arcticus TaxID=1655435 RepID=A0A2U1ZWQ4_9MICO|nr:hypothetical protein C8046_12585 [Serinibacter arcticus]
MGREVSVARSTPVHGVDGESGDAPSRFLRGLTDRDGSGTRSSRAERSCPAVRSCVMFSERPRTPLPTTSVRDADLGSPTPGNIPGIHGVGRGSRHPRGTRVEKAEAPTEGTAMARRRGRIEFENDRGEVVHYARHENGGGLVSPKAEVPDDVIVVPGAYVEAGARIGAGSRLKAGGWIDENAQLGRAVVVAENVHVGPDARIGDLVRLGRGVKIGAGAVVGAGVRVEDDVHVAPGVTIRPGALVKSSVVRAA